MAKILLVEDDQNLREIYGARLEAEGYEIVSAGDGEEALAIAVRERPDLIISDIMMPKISGFDMLDILRSTPETKDVKVIVMTALSQEEDRKRGEKLGADRYVVKSQATLDDVVGMVRELLSPAPATNASDDNSATPQDQSGDDTSAYNQPADTPLPSGSKTLPTDDQLAPADEASLNEQVEQFVATSPLMNGISPQPQPSAQPEQEGAASENPAQPNQPA